MKNPAIHISEATLLEIMQDVLKCKTPKAAVNLIFKLSAGKNITNRTNLVVSKGIKKKIEKVGEFDSDIKGFQTQLILYRTICNHKIIKQVKITDREYAILKEVATIAKEFVKDFNLEEVSGYIEFIKRGIALMGRQYAIGKFKYFKTKIYEEFEYSLQIKADNDKKGTSKLYSIWKHLMLEYSTAAYELTTDKEFVNMIFARQDADELGAEYDQYLIAQFEGLAFLSVVPELGALHGANAKSRYRKYKTELVVVNDEVKNSKHITDEQKAYQRILNKKK